MRKVIHFEDDKTWQNNVRHALLLSTEILPVESFSNLQDYRDANYPQADLYICDRHLPEFPRGIPEDNTWRALIRTVNSLYPDSKIIIFSKHPPADWRRYAGVVDSLDKNDFDLNVFRSRVESLLCLEAGVL